MIMTDFDDGLVGHLMGSLALVVPQPLHWLKGEPAEGPSCTKPAQKLRRPGGLH
jgi:hypothetical protein